MNYEKLGKNIIEQLLMEDFTEKVSLYPGAFKPPHKGHVQIALDSFDYDTSKLILFISSKAREDIEVEKSLKVWELYKQNIPGLKNLEIITTPSPVLAVYNYAKDNPTHDIKAVFGKGEGDRFKSLSNKEKYFNVEIFNAGTVGNFSSTNLRQAIRNKDIEVISSFIPDEVNVDDFLSIFQLNEAIVGDKIECDNCDWSWNIVDGGDDLYMCHKCGHDNTPKLSEKFKHKIQNHIKEYKHYVLNELFEKDLPIIKKTSPLEYIVGDGEDIEAKYYFKFEDWDDDYSLNWKFTDNNNNKSPEAWKQVTTTVFKVLEDWLQTNSPKSIFISGNTSSKTLIYKNYILKLQTLLNNRYVIDNSQEEGVTIRSIEESYKSSINKRMDSLNESYKQSLNYYQNGDLNSKSRIEQWNSVKKLIERKTLKEIYKLVETGEYSDESINILLSGEEPVVPKKFKTQEDKYLQEARYKKFLNESWDTNKARIINAFLDYCTDYLSIDRPSIKLINSPEYTQQYHSFGGYVPSNNKLMVVVHNRNMADILRTIAHEMVHHMQNQDGRLEPTSGEDGSPEENEAHSLAGVIMRQFGRNNPQIYEYNKG